MRKGSILALALLIASPVLAADIDRGLDLWRTAGNGTTFIDFSANPIPAGFFCTGSGAFTGKVAFEGVPLAADPPTALGGADTIIERLDDAAFNRRGVATTRIQVRALSLASVKPISTECGLYAITIALDGEQPTTAMRIVRANEEGGFFKAPLALTAKLTFTPLINREREVVELTRTVDFEISPRIPWTVRPADRPRERGHELVRVDTDGDRQPDRDLGNDSSFLAGLTAQQATRSSAELAAAASSCHCDPSSGFTDGGSYTDGSGACAHLHCPYPVFDQPILIER
jgi:hypothetical protein